MKPMTPARFVDVTTARRHLQNLDVSVFDLMLADCVERYVADGNFLHPDLATEGLFDRVKPALEAAQQTGTTSVSERQIDAALNGVFDALNAMVAVTHQRAGDI